MSHGGVTKSYVGVTKSYIGDNKCYIGDIIQFGSSTLQYYCHVLGINIIKTQRSIFLVLNVVVPTP